MKNYALGSREESKKFITGYTIKDKKIFVEMANNVNHIIRFTKAEENNIKSRMIDQINIGLRDKEKIKQKEKVFNVIAVIGILIGFIGAIAGGIMYLKDISALFKIVFSIAAAMEIIGVAFGIKKAEMTAVLADLEKSVYEQQHEDELNKNIGVSRSNMIGLDKSTIKRIDKALIRDREPFDINTVADYTLEELLTIVENGKKNSEYRGQVKRLILGGKTHGGNQ